MPLATAPIEISEKPSAANTGFETARPDHDANTKRLLAGINQGAANGRISDAVADHHGEVATENVSIQTPGCRLWFLDADRTCARATRQGGEVLVETIFCSTLLYEGLKWPRMLTDGAGKDAVRLIRAAEFADVQRHPGLNLP